MANQKWVDVGNASELGRKPVTRVGAEGLTLALSFADGTFAAIGATCAHEGGPLDEGTLNGDGCIVCPWHEWEYDRVTGRVPGGSECVVAYDVEVRDGRVRVDVASGRSGVVVEKKKHVLDREILREAGPIRVAGISTTVMNREAPRYSTSERLLGVALEHAASTLGAETRLLKLNDLQFRNCEGYYSKSAHSCTWPCTITQADEADEMQQVYEALVFWADVIVVATPIRWGNASSLFYKMAERMNCIQNQITINDRVLIRNKVATFIITGGQDNIQAVAGQLLTFFSEVGFHFPQFPFIAHSRGWDAEDMERNVDAVEKSESLRDGARQLVTRGVSMATLLLGQGAGVESTPRGGRKASPLLMVAR
jgi:multimeric flavodoxin WrbA/nitrite reductase/ring-hydroxylating ferredoxin subunit